MLDEIDQLLRAAALRMSESFVGFLPGIAGLLLIVILAVVFAVLVRMVLVRVLVGVRLEQRAQGLGLGSPSDWSVVGGLALFLARVAMWFIIVAGILVGFSALDAALPGAFARTIFRYVPNVLAALVIVVVGTVLSRFLARSVLIGAVNLQLQAARLLSTGIKWLVILLSWTIALEHLGIGRGILALSFAIVLAGVVLASALAIGNGATEWVRQSLARRTDAPSGPSDQLPHV